MRDVIRKVKCDETKPSCLRCTSTGRRCDGYMPVQPGRSSIQRLTTPILVNTSDGRRAFDFYTRNSALLQGISQGDFWDGVALQLSLREPIVHHAVLAVSGLLEYATSTEPIHNLAAQRDFSLREYSKAIQGLLRWDAKNTTAIPLLVCVLFICIEFLLEHDGASQLHVCQGRTLLSSLLEHQSPDLKLIKNDLVPIYVRLSLASFLFGSRPAPIPDHLTTGMNESQPSFTSIEQARCHLYLLVDQALRFTTRGHPVAYSPCPDIEELNKLAAEQQRLLTRFSEWRTALVVFTASRKEASPTDENFLEIYYNASVIWISTALQPFETAYDTHTAAFASIITHVSTVIHSVTSRPRFSSFTFETELIAPLYWTAVKCRHPLLRRAAVQLLLRDELRNRRENLWSGKTAAVIAMRIIELEEACNDSDVQSCRNTPSSVGDRLGLDIGNHLPQDERQPQISPAADVQVPLSQPPTIPRASLPISEPLSVALDGTLTSITPAASTHEALDDNKVLPILPPSRGVDLNLPYGILESQRIKNTLIEPRVTGGVWVRIFRNPKDDREDWHITREFLPV